MCRNGNTGKGIAGEIEHNTRKHWRRASRLDGERARAYLCILLPCSRATAVGPGSPRSPSCTPSTTRISGSNCSVVCPTQNQVHRGGHAAPPKRALCTESSTERASTECACEGRKSDTAPKASCQSRRRTTQVRGNDQQETNLGLFTLCSGLLADLFGFIRLTHCAHPLPKARVPILVLCILCTRNSAVAELLLELDQCAKVAFPSFHDSYTNARWGGAGRCRRCCRHGGVRRFGLRDRCPRFNAHRVGGGAR